MKQVFCLKLKGSLKILSIIVIIQLFFCSYLINATPNNSNNARSTTSNTLDPANQNFNASQKFLEENKKNPGVITLKSGLQYKIINEGSGTPPTASETVTVKYKGSFIDGKVFENPSQAATFPINQVIPGWSEALQLMKPGAKWIVYVPPHLAYGEKGVKPIIGPNQALIFEIELIDKDADLSEEFKEKGAETWEEIKSLTP